MQKHTENVHFGTQWDGKTISDAEVRWSRYGGSASPNVRVFRQFGNRLRIVPFTKRVPVLTYFIFRFSDSRVALFLQTMTNHLPLSVVLGLEHSGFIPIIKNTYILKTEFSDGWCSWHRSGWTGTRTLLNTLYKECPDKKHPVGIDVNNNNNNSAAFFRLCEG